MTKCEFVMENQLIQFIRNMYRTNEFIPLHAPVFSGNEKLYLNQTIDTTYVSSIGKFVDDFEALTQIFTGTTRAVATVNGTAALQSALYLANVHPGDLVITQALTFVATCNAVSQLGAEPVFIDIDRKTFGLCPDATLNWLVTNAELDDAGCCRHKDTGKIIKAIIPMHTFGHPVRLDELLDISKKWNLCLIEDAAESLGSFYKGHHTGTFGRFGALSFNGNKIITTGGGGMLMCQAEDDGARAKHITTTAKVPHAYEYYHDELAFNYRMPNLNAALGCAQMEQLEEFIGKKRKIASMYKDFFSNSDYHFVSEPDYGRSNYWLNTIICPNLEKRNALLKITNERNVMTRPVWQLMHRLPMFENALRDDLINSDWAAERLVNLPSSTTEI
jgi:aminotransferase in exopolysaccharide biosynthesis